MKNVSTLTEGKIACVNCVMNAAQCHLKFKLENIYCLTWFCTVMSVKKTALKKDIKKITLYFLVYKVSQPTNQPAHQIVVCGLFLSRFLYLLFYFIPITSFVCRFLNAEKKLEKSRKENTWSSFAASC